MRYHVKTASKSVPNPQMAAALQRQLALQEAALGTRRNLLKYEISHEERENRDDADLSADFSNFGLNAALLDVTARTMREIEDARARMRSDSYGKCLECSDRIPLARLEAIPFAEHCRDCQERLDADVKAKLDEQQYRPLF